MLAVENMCRLPAPPESVWLFYTEPRYWPRWSADIEHAEAEAPMQVGTTGRCKYRVLPEGRFRVATFDPPYSFTLDWTTIGSRVRFEHELVRVGAHATRVCERISFHGLLAPVLGLLERPRIRTHWPLAMDCLGWLALESYRAATDRGPGATDREPSAPQPRRARPNGRFASAPPAITE